MFGCILVDNTIEADKRVKIVGKMGAKHGGTGNFSGSDYINMHNQQFYSAGALFLIGGYSFQLANETSHPIILTIIYTFGIITLLFGTHLLYKIYTLEKELMK